MSTVLAGIAGHSITVYFRFRFLPSSGPFGSPAVFVFSMAYWGTFQPAGAGLRHSLHFVWRDGSTSPMLRDKFVEKVLFEFLQWNAAEQGFDVSLISSGVFEKLKLECQGKADEEPLSAFKVFSLERKNLKIVTVYMFNPYVGD